ncbi:hypothetical protein VTJ49DRAFT_3170 [Mycothermus thermophilus]|uniref:DUF1996 domain-containing protein n=1 Tax=Humicola insolens TaxID=85995 RepID=A0ABR3V8B7_HUMIN
MLVHYWCVPRRQCLLCEDEIALGDDDERCLALVGNLAGGFEYSIRKPVFRDRHEYQQWDLLDRLYVAYKWRDHPWMIAESDGLIDEILEDFRRAATRPSSLRRSLPSFLSCAQRLTGLSRIGTLPLELAETIQSLAQPNPLRRMVAALDLAKKLSALPATPEQDADLTDIVSWERGHDPVLVPASDRPRHLGPIIRLTLDFNGLKRLERLPEYPPYELHRSDEEAFLVADESKFADYGLMRFLSQRLLGLSTAGIWDTPTPPVTSMCFQPVVENGNHDDRRFHTVLLSELTGLTFFLGRGGAVIGVHTHTRDAPSAEPTFHRFDSYDREYMAWYYVPLPRSDPLVSISGAVDYNSGRESYLHVYLIRTASGIETVVGTDTLNGYPSAQFMVRATKPTSLVYCTLVPRKRSTSPISMILPLGNPPCPSEPTMLVDVPTMWHPGRDNYPSWYLTYSAAPLKGVLRAHVYFSTLDSDMRCKGILLEYENGTQRALGEIRLLVDPCKTYERPRCIGISPGEEGAIFPMVDFGDEPDRGTRCEWYHMKGRLVIWWGVRKRIIDPSRLTKQEGDDDDETGAFDPGSVNIPPMLRFQCSQLVVERLDPLVNPGQIPSVHLHQIVGGNAFNASMDPALDLPALSTCTSCTFSEDFSNYWTAVLFFRARNGTYKRVYYIPPRDGSKTTAFRPGFRMLVGDAALSTGSPPAADRVEPKICHRCMPRRGDHLHLNCDSPDSATLPVRFCPGGIRSVLTFPTCWDGVNLDSPDHQSHVAYPVPGSEADRFDYAGGVCPESHPVRIPQVMYEVQWDTTPFNDPELWPEDETQQPFVWSTADEHGYSQHGDYIFGWKGDALQRAMNRLCFGDVCESLETQSPELAAECVKPKTVEEDVDGWLEALPGMETPVKK